ncbi:MAG: alpha/beta fold hydrolase [Candidatus Binatia bacterium]
MYATIDGLRFHYAQDGQGTDLLLIHGLGGSLHDWDNCVPEFARYHRVTRWDARGCGESDKPVGPYSPAMFATDLAGLFSACGITRAHVAGISMGGVIAQRFALDFPEHVKSLTLISTSSEVGPEAQAAWEKTAASLEERGFPTSDDFARRPYAANFVTAHPEAMQAMARRTATNDPRAYAAAARAIGSYNWTAELDRLQMPTLILQGAEDRLTPPGGSIKMSRVIPSSRLLMFPDCGHVVPEEKPELFTRTLLAFLAGVDFQR